MFLVGDVKQKKPSVVLFLNLRARLCLRGQKHASITPVDRLKFYMFCSGSVALAASFSNGSLAEER